MITFAAPIKFLKVIAETVFSTNGFQNFYPFWNHFPTNTITRDNSYF